MARSYNRAALHRSASATSHRTERKGDRDVGSIERPFTTAFASGDLVKMKKVHTEAEKQPAEHGNISAALEVLKAEIAKTETKGREASGSLQLK